MAWLVDSWSHSFLKLIASKIVEKSSATLGLPDSRETKVALNADHEMICRFASENDESYKHISSLIVDLANSAVMAEKGVSRQGTFSSTVSTLVESTLVTEALKETFCKLYEMRTF